MMKKLLIRLSLWVARKCGWMPPSPEPMLSTARALVAEQNSRWPDRDGETKRASVYRSLINTFPTASKRDISRAIEEAVCSEY